MKIPTKIILLFIFVELTFTQQSFGQWNMEGGVKAGYNYSNLNLGPSGQLIGINYYHWASSYHLGVFAKFKYITKNKTFNKFAVQPELLFSNQGQTYTTGNTSDLRTNLYYLNLPVMIKYYIIDGINVQVGPQVGFRVGGKGDLLELSGGNIIGQPLLQQSLSSYTRPFDFAFAFGIGFDAPFGGSLTVRYCLGLPNVNKYYHSNNQPVSAQGNIITTSCSTAYTRNQVFQISLGYRFLKISQRLHKKKEQAI